MRLLVETETGDVGLLAISADDFAAHLLKVMPDDIDEVIDSLVANERSDRSPRRS